MNVLAICKFPTNDNPTHFFVDTEKLTDKKVANLLEKIREEITLSSNNYFGNQTEKDNQFKSPFRRYMSWLEESLFDNSLWAGLTLPAAVDKIIYITINE